MGHVTSYDVLAAAGVAQAFFLTWWYPRDVVAPTLPPDLLNDPSSKWALLRADILACLAGVPLEVEPSRVEKGCYLVHFAAALSSWHAARDALVQKSVMRDFAKSEDAMQEFTPMTNGDLLEYIQMFEWFMTKMDWLDEHCFLRRTDPDHLEHMDVLFTKMLLPLDTTHRNISQFLCVINDDECECFDRLVDQRRAVHDAALDFDADVRRAYVPRSLVG